MSNSYLAGAGVFVAWAALVAICDLRSRRVPNPLVLAGLALAIVCAVWQTGPFHIDLKNALIGLLAGTVVLMPFFLLGVMGAADVKVFAVLGAWCGMVPLIGLWIAASLAAGIHALLLLLRRRRRKALAGRVGIAIRVGDRGTPYATLLTAPAILMALRALAGVLS